MLYYKFMVYYALLFYSLRLALQELPAKRVRGAHRVAHAALVGSSLNVIGLWAFRFRVLGLGFWGSGLLGIRSL